MLGLSLSGGAFLGWALGANDTGNVFGTAVASRIISFRKASILCALAVIAGAYLQGNAGIGTYRSLTTQSEMTVIIVVFSAAITVTLMTLLKLPISTSQAVVGAITGIGLATKNVNWWGLEKIVICWIATPIGAMLIAILLYYLLGALIVRMPISILTRDKLLWGGLLITGVYGSYALGANNVANVTGVLSGPLSGTFSDTDLALFGGAAIAFGTITFSKRVMLAVGADIMTLDAFSGLVAVAAMALTVHIFAMIGVPVSTSQGVVGAIFGIGLIRGVNTVNYITLRNILFGWFMTPSTALIFAAAAFAIFI